jgi:ATP phosphoribosyltransferase
MTAASSRERLRIAIQKSGRLAEASQDLLTRCGLKFRFSRDRLFCFGENLAVDLLLVRDDDIPDLIGQGACDMGIVGRNILREQTADAQNGAATAVEIRALGFGRCRLAIALPADSAYSGAQTLCGLRIATTYPALLRDWLRAQGVDARVVELSGSVEISPRLGTADAICDLVSTGATLAANQLHEVVTVLESEAVLVGSSIAPGGRCGELRDLLIGRIDGVVQVRESRLLLLHAPRSAVAEIARLLPHGQVPTVSPIEGSDGAVALQAVCYGAVTWQHLEAMKQAGACGMLVLPVEKMLA